MESLEEEAEAGPGFEAPAGCRGGGYPQTSPRSPPRPPPAASAARPGAGSRGRAGSPGRRAAAAAPSKRPFSLQQRLVEPPQARPEEAASVDRAAEAGHLCASEGGRSGAGEAPRGGKNRKKKRRRGGGGEAAEKELLETPF